MPPIPEEIEVWEEGKIGEVLKTIKMPKPGDKVRVKDLDVLFGIFGEKMPTKPAVVVKVFHPEDEENIWDFDHGWAIQVTWSKRSRVLWSFDICELEIVG
jgi:hypothetical protein